MYSYFYCHKYGLLGQRLKELAVEIEKLEQRLHSETDNLEQQRGRESDLRSAIDDHGGRRLEELRRDIQRLEKERLGCSDDTEPEFPGCAL